MGFLGSWAVLAISHHALVAWAAACCGKHNFDQYSILGDDIAIFDKAVADYYLVLLSKLGVDVSLQKSFMEDGLAEFAKAYYRKGVDFKPISPSMLL